MHSISCNCTITKAPACISFAELDRRTFARMTPTCIVFLLLHFITVESYVLVVSNETDMPKLKLGCDADNNCYCVQMSNTSVALLGTLVRNSTNRDRLQCTVIFIKFELRLADKGKLAKNEIKNYKRAKFVRAANLVRTLVSSVGKAVFGAYVYCFREGVYRKLLESVVVVKCVLACVDTDQCETAYRNFSALPNRTFAVNQNNNISIWSHNLRRPDKQKMYVPIFDLQLVDSLAIANASTTGNSEGKSKKIFTRTTQEIAALYGDEYEYEDVQLDYAMKHSRDAQTDYHPVVLMALGVSGLILLLFGVLLLLYCVKFQRKRFRGSLAVGPLLATAAHARPTVHVLDGFRHLPENEFLA